MEYFDKERVYDSEISPLIRKINDICTKEGIPMIASFTIKNDVTLGVLRCSTLVNNVESRCDENLKEAIVYIRMGSGVPMGVIKNDN